jgi:hypothetical protein
MRLVAVLGILLSVATLAHAGAWGAGSFENDDALDWVAKCIKSMTTSPVASAFDAVLRGKYVEAPDGSAAVVAAEVVAGALGRPSTKMPAELRTWIQRQPREELSRLAPVARRALARVLDPTVSELHQLWTETSPDRWRAEVADLQSRLGR